MCSLPIILNTETTASSSTLRALYTALAGTINNPSATVPISDGQRNARTFYFPLLIFFLILVLVTTLLSHQRDRASFTLHVDTTAKHRMSYLDSIYYITHRLRLRSLSKLDFRINADAIRSAIDQVFDFVDSPSPGTPHSSHDSTPPTISLSSQLPEAALAEEETEEAVIVPLPELPWHLTQPYKMLKELRKYLESEQSSHSPTPSRELANV
ncbi:hypothetical protein EUX98_g3108 [Antrodiella citrinella]|uniref:Uncharacterized protein n=1 Tax=Antrodiella citrinella TaxID=2447956 RepID=A0A4S4MZW8_9APHY|nr:hypothetical protein EUX98_g3108 [Antrodiella citrinella]